MNLAFPMGGTQKRRSATQRKAVYLRVLKSPWLFYAWAPYAWAPSCGSGGSDRVRPRTPMRLICQNMPETYRILTGKERLGWEKTALTIYRRWDWESWAPCRSRVAVPEVDTIPRERESTISWELAPSGPCRKILNSATGRKTRKI